jgi:hypothetical protein
MRPLELNLKLQAAGLDGEHKAEARTAMSASSAGVQALACLVETS